ncbi:AAA family ATPase, partial [Microbispora maris]|uniref:AAA family ATPase n=1 Tax=Microbispora maris TaxID=3144104 RepID=UPI0031FE0FB6
MVLDRHRILTCAHVALPADALWVSFPLSDGDFLERRRVTSIKVPEAMQLEIADVAVLYLEEEIPAGVVPAPLRRPRGVDCPGIPWWAYGFAGSDPHGNSTQGNIGDLSAYGYIRLDSESRHHVEDGFSGAGVWSPDYQAVIGMVSQADYRGDGRGITLYQIDRWLPDEEITALTNWTVEQSDNVALAAWGWELSKDPEADRHWRPRARGVTQNGEPGHHFRGRERELRIIVEWLRKNTAERRVLVVTGDPGVGKSALLGQIVTTADPSARAQLPQEYKGIFAPLGSVACAVHARGKTALEVASEIARTASAPLPQEITDLAPAIRHVLEERDAPNFNVIIDALDEATTPIEARAIVSGVALPLMETCADIGARVVVGTRRRDEGGELLTEFAGQCEIVDLNDVSTLDDLTSYATEVLQQRPDSPYLDAKVARPVAEQIARAAGDNFLIAGLVARDHSLHDPVAATPETLSFSTTIGSVLRAYVARLVPVAGVPAATVLTALAFAEAPGLSADLWSTAIAALGGRKVPAAALVQFARSEAARFLIDANSQEPTALFRLFHQALNDTLLEDREKTVARSQDEGRLTQAFLEVGRRVGWQNASAYLLRSLPVHAARSGNIDSVLNENEFLLHADLKRLLPFVDMAVSPEALAKARLLRLTPQLVALPPATRAAMLTITEALENLGDDFRSMSLEMPYRAEWAQVPPRVERLVLEGHTNSVEAVCAFTSDGHTMLATASTDQTIRIWDPDIGQLERTIEGL